MSLLEPKPEITNDVKYSRFTLARLALIAALLIASMATPSVSFAQFGRLSPTLCAVSDGQLACYNLSRQAFSLSTAPERVIDFSLSPDYRWIAYRVFDGQHAKVYLDAIYGGHRLEIDGDALPPVGIEPRDQSLVWSPDGLTIAYVVADGLRIAVPAPHDKPVISQVTDRLFTNMTFSPSGNRLAAQSIDDSWVIYQVANQYTAEAHMQREHSFDPPAAFAWFDDNTALLAPQSGSAYKLNLATPEQLIAPISGAQGIFTVLRRTTTGTIRALNRQASQDFGAVVNINPDGTIAQAGATIDGRVMWIQDTRLMLYITSGTPIAVDPQTGEEDTLALRDVSHLTWETPSLPEVDAFGMDADIYYLAPDADRQQQVWRFLRADQHGPTQLTRRAAGVDSVAVSSNRSLLAVASERQLFIERVAPLGELPPTPTLRYGQSTPTPSPALVQFEYDAPGLVWNLDSSEIVYMDRGGLFSVAIDGSRSQRLLQASNGTDYDGAQLTISPDGRYVLVELAANNTATGSLPLAEVIPLQADLPMWTLPKLAPQDRLHWTADGLLWISYTSTQGGIVRLLRAGQPADNAATLVTSPWPIIEANFLQNVLNPPLLYLEHIGWSAGPQVVQLWGLPSDGSAAQKLGAPILASDVRLSPTGRLAAGLAIIERRAEENADLPIINQLMIVDLQNGRRIGIQNAVNVTEWRWIF